MERSTIQDMDDELPRALTIISAVGSELSESPFSLQTQPRPLERITSYGEAEAARRSALGKQWSEQIAALDAEHLPHPIALSLRVAAATAARLACELPWYWHVHDPLGLGFFGMSGPTAYCGGWYLSVLCQLLARHRFEVPGDCERYLGLTADVAAVVRSMRTRLEGQAARGIIMPAAQLAQAKSLMVAIASRTEQQLRVDPARYLHLAPARRFKEQLGDLLEGELRQSFIELAAWLDGADAARAAQAVGLSQYAGGAEVYAGLVKQHTTLDLSVDQVHATGHARMAQIRDSMAQIRAEVGFAGDDKAYLASIDADPRWRAADADGVAAHFRRCIDRVAPLTDTWFRFGPAAPYGVAPLPDALSGSMTFGYYQVPATREDTGTYLFNARNMTQKGLANVPALTFHELVPGHHIHVASQAENEKLPAVSKYNSFNAFNEGWAEYAATLAGEYGLYQTAEERFGRLMMDAFLTCRLVVDTGMNAMGWTLDAGRRYLHENAFMSEQEVATESIRYSCDMPAQSLAYKLGDTFMMQQRERMRAALGARFDLRDFHDAILRNGAMPLPLVAHEIDRVIAQLRN